MLITRISKARNLGVFRDFYWPSDLPDFSRFNLIYGWNGTGKSTLSNLLRALETQTNCTDAHVTITINGSSLEGGQFETTSVPIRVFNRTFIEENVFTLHGEVTPIFVLGKESVEKQKHVDQLKSSLQKSREELRQLHGKAATAKKALENFCTLQARAIRDQLTATGSDYRNYDKRNFRATADKLAAGGEVSQYMIDDVEQERLRKQHLATEKPRIATISYSFPDLTVLRGEVSQLLGRTVVSSVIESLRKDPDLARWTRDGLSKHRERESAVCLFCNQLLPEGRIKELEAHFTDEYERFLGEIDATLHKVQGLIQNTKAIMPPNKAEFYEDLAKEYEAARPEFTDEVTRVRDVLESFRKAINSKRDAPFEQLEVDLPDHTPRREMLEKLNAIIAKHNKASDEFRKRVILARKKLEQAIVAVSIGEYKRLIKDVEDTNRAVNQKHEAIKKMEDEIAKLEREIIGHRRPAEELNKDLRAYLGHSEISLRVKDTGYQITRNGAEAQGLSEGEKTAIALLYFLKSLQDRQFNIQEGIVVIDDPVSSLDANALFYAFGFIKERTKDAGQLFILTHNFMFFKQVQNWFRYLKGQNKKDLTKRPAHFYMLECKKTNGSRRSTIRNLDPLLEKYHSEYHYLFQLVYNTAYCSSQDNLEFHYVMPNVARRLLEAFLAFRNPAETGDLYTQL